MFPIPRKLVSCGISLSTLFCMAYVLISINIYFDKKLSDSNFVLKERPRPKSNFLSELKVSSSETDGAVKQDFSATTVQQQDIRSKTTSQTSGEKGYFLRFSLERKNRNRNYFCRYLEKTPRSFTISTQS
jgi:hypothetical protein